MAVGFGADTTVDELILNHAQWHKSCHAECNANRLARAKKRITPMKTQRNKMIQEGGDCRARAGATPGGFWEAVCWPPNITNSNTTKKVSLTRRQSAMDLVQVIIEMGNPLTNTIPELLALDTQDVIDNYVVNTVSRVADIDKEQNSSSNKSVVTHLTQSIHDHIKKNSLLLFRMFIFPAPKTKARRRDRSSCWRMLFLYFPTSI